MDWSTLECALHGHATFDPNDDYYSPKLHHHTPHGISWKCLRCGHYILGDPSNVDAEPQDKTPEKAPEIWRGDQVRDRYIIRFIAVERGLRGLLVALIAWVVFTVRGSQDTLEDRINKMLPVFKAFKKQTGIDIYDSQVLHLLNAAIKTTPHTLALIGMGLAAYGALQIVEGVGLWNVQRWAEYLAVVATSAFIPIEIYEIHHSVTVLKVAALILNIAAVAWLVWNKKLFGANGGFDKSHGESLSGIPALDQAITLPE